jgi:beta-lactamase class A
MRRDPLIATVTLTVVAMVCAGCGREVAGAGQHAGNTGAVVALSATPRTITWKKPTPKDTVRHTATPAAHASATPSAGSSAASESAAAVAPLVRADDYHVAVAVADLTTGQTAACDGTQEFITASIAKADILSTLLYQSQSQGGLSNREQKLATTMIEKSDNGAADDLYDDAGGASEIDAANQAFGLVDTTVGTDGYWGLTTTTADDQIRLLRQIFTAQSTLSPASRSYIQGLMGGVEPDEAWGVPAVADEGTSFAVKNGWLPDPTTHLWEINSIGEVTHDGQLMLIAVLSTDNDNYADGIALVQEVASKAAAAVAPVR